MEVRHQVFVSSTFRDLVEERREVMQALLELDCIPAGMELFPASNEAALRLIQDVISQSDYYVVIIGGRYGSTNADGVSFTEIEYDYAVGLGKPVLGFLHGNPGAIPVEASELGADARARLESFRKKVEARHCKYWTSAAELGGVVSRSIVQERKRTPAPGWVRSDTIGGPDVLARLSDLRDENDALRAQLDSMLASALPGTEELEQGDDKVTISISYNYNWDGPLATWSEDSTWDAVIGIVGPMMFDEATESSLFERLKEEASRRGVSLGEIRPPKQGEYLRVRLDSETQSTILVQLLALGLIEKSIRRRYVRDTATYWRLTGYGERYVTRLRARRRVEAALDD